MLACEICQNLFNIPTKIARIRHQSYLKNDWKGLFSPEKLGVDIIISPEREVAQNLLSNIQIVGAFDVLAPLSEKVKILGIVPQESSKLLNTPLKHFPEICPDLDFHPLCIRRKNDVFCPTDDDVMLNDDEVYVACQPEYTNGVVEAFGYYKPDKRKILIIGGGNIGEALTHSLQRFHKSMKTTLIEFDSERIEQIACRLKHTQLLQGDALDPTLLKEANVDQCETVLCITNEDKVNILSALLAKQMGAKYSLSLLNNNEYRDMVLSLGVDAIINPRSITVSSILQYVRKGRLRSLRTIFEGNFEIIEALARQGSYAIGMTLEQIKEQTNARIVAVERSGSVDFKPKTFVINSNDKILMIIPQDGIDYIEDIFSVKRSTL